MRVHYECRALFLSPGEGEGLRQLDVCPNRPFRPFALLLWGTAGDTFVRQLSVGRAPQFVHTLPGSEFEADLDFGAFEALLEDRADQFMPALGDVRSIGPFLRLLVPVVEPGDRVELLVEGPIERAVLLGDVPRVEAPSAEAAA